MLKIDLNNRNKKLFLMAVGVGIVGAALTGWWMGFGRHDNTPAQRTTVVTVDTIEDVVTAQGQLEPKNYVDVGTQVSGQLKKVHVELGDDVAAGDLLAEIDQTVYISRLNQAKAQLASLQAQKNEQIANTALAEQNYTRSQKLAQANALSTQELDAAAAELKAAKARVSSLDAQIAQAKSSIQEAEANLTYTTIYAPISGTVVSQTTREGQTVNASQSAPTIVQVANLDVMTVRAQVAEADIMKLTPSMAVHFTTLGDMDTRWEGTVRQILPSPEEVNDVVLYNVLIDADNNARKLLPGMSTQVFFEVASANNVLTIPASALGQAVNGKPQTYKVAILNAKQQPQLREVSVGLMTRTKVEIKNGLKQGDVVVISSAAKGESASASGGQQPSPPPML